MMPSGSRKICPMCSKFVLLFLNGAFRVHIGNDGSRSLSLTQDSVAGTGVVEQKSAVELTSTFYEWALQILPPVKILPHVPKAALPATASQLNS